MATLVKNIEREFLLTTAMRERAAIVMAAGSGEWNVRIKAVSATTLTLVHEAPLSVLRKGLSCDFHYSVRGQTIAFKAPVLEPGERVLVVAMPDKVYKNLSRRFARLPPPGDLTASFSFSGERYDLDFPTTSAFRPATEPVPSPDFDPADLRELMAEFERKALSIASDRGIVMFKDRAPESVVERVTAATGRTFYLPTALSGIPRSDPFLERTILTRDDFLSWFSDSGKDPAYAEDELVRIERQRRTDGVLSELLVPILFQDYAIGCASIVNRQVGKPPFDLGCVETFNAFARVFAWSLKIHGYFKDAPRLSESYRTQVMDVSAGGLMFACRDARLIQLLKDGTAVGVRMAARKRAIDAQGVIRRHHAGGTEGFFGIEFTTMAPEDFRFLFEYLYARPFTDEDAGSIEGLRITSA